MSTILDGVVLGLHLATAHFGGHDLNAVNPGVYVRHESGATAGTFRNSYRRQSAYAGWTFETPGRGLALTVGAITGYPAAKVMPMVAPSARLPLSSSGALRLAYIPKPLKSGTASGLHLSVEWSL